MKIFAYYLPQFYPIPENDKYWGKGFTDWDNVKAAKPLFKGHEQPRTPARFGYYDLRDIEIIRAQAEYARKIGVNGFSIWHYWFGNGKQALEKPVQLLFKNQDINIEYYLTWVNANWTKSWVGSDKEIIFRQIYDKEDYKRHFDYILPFFLDKRYFKIDGKPVLSINNPRDFNVIEFIEIFDQLAQKNGLPGIVWKSPYLQTLKNQLNLFEYYSGYPPGDISLNFRIIDKVKKILNNKDKPRIIDYKTYSRKYKSHISKMIKRHKGKYIPSFLPNWDNTPRYKRNGFLFINNDLSTIEDLFGYIVDTAWKHDIPFILIKSWNEWAEGNYIEPDQKNGELYGEIIRKKIMEKQK